MENLEGAGGGVAASERHKRLFGLWLVCLLAALGAVVSFEHIVRGTALGMLVFGALGTLFAAVAVGLWLRRRWAWWVAACLLLLSCAFCIVGYVLAQEDNDIRISLSLVALVNASVLGYLIWRRRFFARTLPRPRLRSQLSVTTLGAIVVLGICYGLLLNVDDERVEYPELALTLRSVPKDENGATLLLALMKSGDCEAFGANLWPPEGAEERRQWVSEVREVVAEKTRCFEGLDRVLSRPDCVFDDPQFHDDRWGYFHGSGMGWTADLLAAKSAVELADGRTVEAMETALKTLRLGMRLVAAQGNYMDYLAGYALINEGLRSVRAVAAAKGCRTEILLRALDDLSTDDVLAEAFRDAMRSDYRSSRASIRRVNAGEIGVNRQRVRWSQSFYGKLMPNLNPFVKINMSSNLLGQHYERIIERSKNAFYVPDPWPDNFLSRLSPTPAQWVRNPVGVIYCHLEAQSTNYQLEFHFSWTARLRATRLFLALRLYHLEHGKLPETLEELAPEYIEAVPPDPLNGKAFVYEPTASPPLLVSLGPNGKRDVRLRPSDGSDDRVYELKFAGDE